MTNLKQRLEFVVCWSLYITLTERDSEREKDHRTMKKDQRKSNKHQIFALFFAFAPCERPSRVRALIR